MTESQTSPGKSAERKKRLWGAGFGLLLFVASGLLLLPGVVDHREPEAASPPAAIDPGPDAGSSAALEAAHTEVAPAMSQDAAVAIESERFFDCMLTPNEIVDIGSPITGLIEELPVERSDTVEVGQVLVRLDAEVEAAAVRVAQARAEREVDIEASEASLDLDRKREARAWRLFETSTLSLDQREEVEARALLSSIELERSKEDRRLASLQLDQALATLERRVIRSPVDGIVMERLMSEGEVVDEETIVRIAQVDPLRVESLLPSSWFGRVGAGDTAEVIVEGYPDEPRIAEVAIVDGMIDGASGTFGLQLRLDNPERNLPAGLRCQVRFPGD